MRGSEAMDREAAGGGSALVGLVSDTHGLLRPELLDLFCGVDLVLHAGDVGDAAILARLEQIAPVRAVCGNTDRGDVRQRIPEAVELEVAGLRIAVVHGHRSTDPDELVMTFPGADVVVHGHTHEPRCLRREGILIVNPGSAGPRRFSLPVTAALLRVREGTPSLRVVDLDTGEAWRPEG